MAYEHDIFISYKRDPEVLEWIRLFLKPQLSLRVRMELRRSVDVYVHEVDDHIPASAAWPVELGEVIACSRVLVALWTGDYLSSEWCRQELSLMMQRERQIHARTARNKFGLVIPIIAHDGETIPEKLTAAQRLEVSDYFNSQMVRNGAKAERFADLIALHAGGIARAIQGAPRWKKKWPRRAAQKLLNAFNAKQRTQRTLPRYSRR
jgi:hypothetical protein